MGKSKVVCTFSDCRERDANLKRHLEHPFYKEAADYREKIRQGQIVKGSDKYPEPFNSASWTTKQLLEHAMQENVDQGHYIYGLFEHVQAIEHDLGVAKNEAEYWRMRTIENEENALKYKIMVSHGKEKPAAQNELYLFYQKTKGVVIDERI